MLSSSTTTRRLLAVFIVLLFVLAWALLRAHGAEAAFDKGNGLLQNTPVTMPTLPAAITADCPNGIFNLTQNAAQVTFCGPMAQTDNNQVEGGSGTQVRLAGINFASPNITLCIVPDKGLACSNSDKGVIGIMLDQPSMDDLKNGFFDEMWTVPSPLPSGGKYWLRAEIAGGSPIESDDQHQLVLHAPSLCLQADGQVCSTSTLNLPTNGASVYLIGKDWIPNGKIDLTATAPDGTQATFMNTNGSPNDKGSSIKVGGGGNFKVQLVMPTLGTYMISGQEMISDQSSDNSLNVTSQSITVKAPPMPTSTATPVGKEGSSSKNGGRSGSNTGSNIGRVWQLFAIILGFISLALLVIGGVAPPTPQMAPVVTRMPSHTLPPPPQQRPPQQRPAPPPPSHQDTP